MPPFNLGDDPRDSLWEQENRNFKPNPEEPTWPTVLAWLIILAFVGTLLWGFVEIILWITR